MTTRDDTKKASDKKTRRLTVRKETVADLAPRRAAGENIRGGKAASDVCKSRDCER
jgi:hypothetical protein